MDYSLMHPRDEVVVTMQRIYRYKMTTTSGGNVSIRDENGDIWITPAAVDKATLRPDDIVRVASDEQIDGRHRPSSEFPFHQAIYEARPDLRAIVHAHPVALVAFSASRRVPDTRLFPQAWRLCGSVGFAPYARPGSAELGDRIAKAFEEGFNCVILENHGVVTGATNLQQAFQRFETLECAAKTIIKGTLVGEVRCLDDAQLDALTDDGASLPQFEPPRHTNREKELRREVCDFVHRGYQQGLLTSTAGSFSARIDDTSFVITPFPVDRYAIEPEDLVLIRGREREMGKTPSRAVLNHRAIYDRHPDVGAVVNAFPVNAAAFSVCGLPVNTRTIPESYVFLREVTVVPYRLLHGDGAELAERIAPDHPIVIAENDGVLVTGKTVLNAYDRLEVLEYTAEAVINSQPIGGTSPMSDEVIDDLKEAFPL